MKTLKIFSIALWLLFISSILTAQNHESVAAKITIGEGMGSLSDTLCQAQFSVVTDSLTSYPFYYHFKDLSTGSINAWYWDFGDGSFSTEQNPTHQFEEPGNYKVCLTISDQNDTSR